MKPEAPEEFDGPSKSQRKRDAHRQQDLGTRLTACSEAQLRSMQLPERLVAAIVEFNRLPNSHGARRRQLQYIGKLMRACDFDELTHSLDRLENPQPAAVKELPRALVWTDKILEGGDEAITAVLNECPALERQKLRQFFRDYQSRELKAAESQPADDKAGELIRSKLRRYLSPYLTD